MSVFVVDASVVLKWFFPEEDSDMARRLLETSHQFVAPDLLFPEVGNAIWKRVCRGELSDDESRQLIGDIVNVPVETVATPGLIGDACAIAVASGQTVYDSTYLALAVRLQTTVVTADRRLQNSISGNPVLSEHLCMVNTFPA